MIFHPIFSRHWLTLFQGIFKVNGPKLLKMDVHKIFPNLTNRLGSVLVTDHISGDFIADPYFTFFGKTFQIVSSRNMCLDKVRSKILYTWNKYSFGTENQSGNNIYHSMHSKHYRFTFFIIHPVLRSRYIYLSENRTKLFSAISNEIFRR